MPSLHVAQPAVELTHPCVRCGAPVPLELAMCERCNPLDLAQPAATQVHGTVFLAIGVSVVALAIIGRLALTGIGPFTAQVAQPAQTVSGLNVTLTVTNEGTKAGHVTCRIYDPAVEGIGPDSAIVTSPGDVPPSQSITFSTETALLGTTIRPLAADCR